jgi:hypothetical protein
MWTRRNMIRQAGTAAVLATTAPWWVVRRAHAARQKKLTVWNPTTLAPQVEKIMEEQCYAYIKQAGIKESELDYSVIGSGQRSRRGTHRILSGSTPGYQASIALRDTCWR